MSDSTQSHRQAWEAIPWIVNHTAPEADISSAQHHLRECADCRDALAFEERLREAMLSPPANQIDAEQSWRRLSARIDGSVAVSRRAHEGAPKHAHRAATMSLPVRWLAAAVVVEALTLGAILSSYWMDRGARPPVYHTLSQTAGAAAGPTIRVVLSPSMTLDQLRVLLIAAHLQVVGGPSEAGVWSLAPAADASTMATDAALRELRANPQVRFAEPITGGAPEPPR